MAKQTLWPTGGKRRAAGRGRSETDGERGETTRSGGATAGMKGGRGRNEQRGAEDGGKGTVEEQ